MTWPRLGLFVSINLTIGVKHNEKQSHMITKNGAWSVPWLDITLEGPFYNQNAPSKGCF